MSRNVRNFYLLLGILLKSASALAVSAPIQFLRYDLQCNAVQKVSITSDPTEKKFSVFLYLSEAEKAFLQDRTKDGHQAVEIYFRGKSLGRWTSRAQKTQIQSGIVGLGPYPSKKHAKLMAVRLTCRQW